MIIVNSQTYSTIVDASGILGVSAKTIRGYIAKGIIPKPPTVKYGVRLIKHFPPEYLSKAKLLLDNYRTLRNT